MCMDFLDIFEMIVLSSLIDSAIILIIKEIFRNKLNSTFHFHLSLTFIYIFFTNTNT